MKKIYPIPNILAVIILSLLFAITACKSDEEPDPTQNTPPPTQGQDPEEPDEPENPGETEEIDPHEASKYLIFDSAVEQPGSLSAAGDGQLLIDVKDTIFSIKGYARGNRIRIQHATDQEITGVFVQVKGSDTFYDVPEMIVDGEVRADGYDSIAAFFIGLEPEGAKSLPYTVEILIQPHDASGNPMDEFIRYFTVEEPANSSSGSRMLNNCSNICDSEGEEYLWVWNHTTREYGGHILNYWAPGVSAGLNSRGFGCCDRGTNYSPGQNPQCYEDTPYMDWIQIEVSDFYVRYYEYFKCWNDSRFFVKDEERTYQYFPHLSDFCSGEAGYELTINHEGDFGTHDYTPGSNHMNITFNAWEGGGWKPQGGDLTYTCHSLIMEFGREDHYKIFYKKVFTQSQQVENTDAQFFN